jgi:hypothetical protein
MPKNFVLETSSNNKIVRDKYLKWRNDVIVNNINDLAFSFKDLLSVKKGEWMEITEEEVIAQSNTIKSYVLEDANRQLPAVEIKCHPDDLEKAIKKSTGHLKGFLLSLSPKDRYFAKKVRGATVPIFVVKEGSLPKMKVLANDHIDSSIADNDAEEQARLEDLERSIHEGN